MMSHPQRYRNRIRSNESSFNELQGLLDKVMQWRHKYDAENKIFPELWRQVNQEYEAQLHVNERKEAEPSPIYHNVHMPKKAISNETVHHKSDGDDFDPAQDPQFFATLQQMANKQLQQPQKLATKHRKLNANVKSFVPGPQRLPTVFEQHAMESPSPSICSTSSTEMTEPMNPIPCQITSQLAYLAVPICPIVVNYISNYTPVTQVTQLSEVTDVRQPIQYKNGSTHPQPMKTNTTMKFNETKPKHAKKSTQIKPKAPKRIMDFKRKFSNHANGNFYVPKDIPPNVSKQCREHFDDNKLTYYYLKQSIAMQVNDGCIYVMCCDAGLLCIINIDLHFTNGDTMYLIAMENDVGFRDRIPWSIKHIMSASQIAHQYGIHQLPRSSRNASYFQRMLKKPPVNVPANIVWETNFRSLPQKENPDKKFPRSQITEQQLKKYCARSWEKGIIVPVVIIKGKRQWVEWKKFITIFDVNGRKQEICISLDYKGKTWTIGCIDSYVEGIYYKHRLTGSNHKFCYAHKELMGRITTSVSII